MHNRDWGRNEKQLAGFVYPVIQMLHLDTRHYISTCFYLVHPACEHLSGNLHQQTIMNTCDRSSLQTPRLQMNGLPLLTRMGRQGPGNQTLVVNVEASAGRPSGFNIPAAPMPVFSNSLAHLLTFHRYFFQKVSFLTANLLMSPQSSSLGERGGGSHPSAWGLGSGSDYNMISFTPKQYSSMFFIFFLYKLIILLNTIFRLHSYMST